MPMYRSPKRIYLNADRTAIVPEDSPEARFLLVGAGCEIPEAEARRYGLLDTTESAAPAPSAKAVESPPADKAVRRPPKTKGAGDAGV